MTAPARVAVVIPALNEEETIAAVVREVAWQVNAEVVVVDNGSTDATALVAATAGARVVREPMRGYGRACMAGAAAAHDCEIIVFMDGDGSDIPADIPLLLDAIEGDADLALGVRRGVRVQSDSIAPAALFGNWLCSWLLRLLYGRRLHDLSPLKAVRRPLLDRLALREQTYGWTVELLAKSLRADATIVEVPVGYCRRAGGMSKVSGDLRAATRAGVRILTTIARVALEGRRVAVLGVLCGMLVAAAGLALLAAWLLSVEAASPRVLITVWLAAWPTVLLGIGGGYTLTKLAALRRPRLPGPP
jgi:glycosyltransferase involved in cell wall biosynthesis